MVRLPWRSTVGYLMSGHSVGAKRESQLQPLLCWSDDSNLIKYVELFSFVIVLVCEQTSLLCNSTFQRCFMYHACQSVCAITWTYSVRASCTYISENNSYIIPHHVPSHAGTLQLFSCWVQEAGCLFFANGTLLIYSQLSGSPIHIG